MKLLQIPASLLVHQMNELPFSADQEKEFKAERIKRGTERRDALRLSREARVFPEVEIDDPSHILVNVRHVSLGVVTRSFKKRMDGFSSI